VILVKVAPGAPPLATSGPSNPAAAPPGPAPISFLNQSLFWGVNDRDASTADEPEPTNVSLAPTNVLRWPGGGLGDRWDYQAMGGRGWIWANNSSQHNYIPSFSMWNLSEFLRNLSGEGDPQQLIVTLPGEINNATQATDEVVFITKNLGIQPAYWEIGNEPGLWTHFNIPWANWSQNVDSPVYPKQYALVVHNYTTEILRVDPSAKFIVWPGYGKGADDTPWIKATLIENCAVAGAVAIHVYPAGNGSANESLGKFYSTIAGPNGLDYRVPADLSTIRSWCPGVPLFVDELGTATGNAMAPVMSSYADVPFVTAEIDQAMILNVTNVDYFALDSSYGGAWFDGPSTVRPTFYLYTDVFEYLPRTEAQNVTALTDPTAGVWAVHTANASQSALLVANANATDSLTVNLTTLGFPSGAPSEAITWNSSSPMPVATGFEPPGALAPSWTIPAPGIALFIANTTAYPFSARAAQPLTPVGKGTGRTGTDPPLPASNQTWLDATNSVHPAARSGYGFTYDTGQHYALLFGGVNGSHVYGDTWTLENGVWTNITSDLTISPPARYGATLVYQKHDGFVLLFGGRAANGTLLDDTWGFNGTTWALLPSPKTPTARFDAEAAYYNRTGAVVLFGGYGPSGAVLSDTWYFRNNSTGWQHGTGSGPPGVAGAVFANVTGSGYDLLYGGYNSSSGYSTATYTWGAGGTTTWSTALTVNTTPGELTNASAAWNNRDKYLTIFGGFSPTAGLQNTTWAWNATAQTFVEVPTFVSPPPVANLSATFDVGARQIVIFGGSGAGGVPFDGTWYLGSNFSATLKHVLNGSIPIGQPENYSVTPDGGLAPYTYSYVGLPPGCSSANQPYVNCTPQAGGKFITHAYVTDAIGQEVETNGVTVYVLTPNHLVVRVACSPSCAVALGNNVYIDTNTTGEPLYDNFTYLELPPGCASANVYVVGCAPTETGTWPVEVEVNDSLVHTSYGYANVTVGIPSVPPPPTGLAASGTTTTSVAWSWTQSTGGGIVNDTLYLFTDAGCTGTPVGSSTGGPATTYTSSGLAPATVYSAEATAWNLTGQSAVSECASATTSPSPPPPTTPPAPSSLAGTALSPTSIEWVWSLDVAEYSVVNFTLYSFSGGQCTGPAAAHSLDGTATQLTVTGLAAATTYSTEVTAWNATGQSPASSCAPATTNSAPLTVPPSNSTPNRTHPSVCTTSSCGPFPLEDAIFALVGILAGIGVLVAVLARRKVKRPPPWDESAA
jgi:hypothetical protein